MRASISLGRIAGIRVGINASVFLIIAILVFGLATGTLPASYPGRGIAAYLIAGIVGAVLFLGSLLAHELAHAYLRNEGRWPGDDPEAAADALAAEWGFPRPV